MPFLKLAGAIASLALSSIPIAFLPAASQEKVPQTGNLSCPPPALSRLRRHKILSGETIASIAQSYNLLPPTLIQFNPILQAGSAPPGKEIIVPPLNGIRVEVPRGATWQDLSKAYGVRADVLFEINGCQKPGNAAFIPGITWNATAKSPQGDYTGLKGYPLPAPAQIGLKYGWQTNPATGQSYFHSGIDLLAAPGTPVLAAAAGKVAFLGQEGAYGYLVIIDHGDRRQTRYAHLSRIQVKLGQSLSVGEQLGLTGTTGQPDIPQPHLHFEIRYQLPVGWVAQDPEIHLKINPVNNQK
jgi:murein DD-endopeptidase MepM/ murein hydrolase activator NlpD